MQYPGRDLTGGKRLRIEFAPEHRLAAIEAGDRLAVLFPNAGIELVVDAIVVDDQAIQADPGLLQSIRDQLIRSRYAARTSALRESLYRRLLG